MAVIQHFVHTLPHTLQEQFQQSIATIGKAADTHWANTALQYPSPEQVVWVNKVMEKHWGGESGSFTEFSPAPSPYKPFVPTPSEHPVFQKKI